MKRTCTLSGAFPRLLVASVLCSLGASAQSPGGVSTGLKLWLNADSGVTVVSGRVSQWRDQSGAGKHVRQTTAAQRPSYLTAAGLLNFNPALSFNGSQYLTTLSANAVMTGTHNNINIFVVSAEGVAGGQSSAVISQAPATAGKRFDYITQWTNLNAYMETPNANQHLGLASGVAANVADIWQFTNETGPTGAGIKRSNRNITLNSTAGTSYTATVNNPTLIGSYYGNTHWNGKIGEVLIYSNTALSAADKQKINSYLAVKWGITIDQTVATNYVASDNTVIWNATANSTWKNHITGIGRDDASGLNQKQSRNQETTGGAFVTMGLGTIAATNAANASSYTADKSFEIWGDDGVNGVAPVSITGDGIITLTTDLCSSYSRLGRTFQVQETGSVGAVQVRVSGLAGLSIGVRASDIYLAINNTSTFSGVVTRLVPATSYANGVAIFDNVDFATGSTQYFTLIGKRVNAPANVSNGLKLWLKADAGVNTSGTGVFQWDDQSGLGKNMIGATGSQPTTTMINYNPAIRFNGSQNMATPATNPVMVGAHNNINIFAVTAEGTAGGQSSAIISQAPSAAGSRFDYITQWTNLNAYMETPNANQHLGLASGVVPNVADVWQFTNETGPTGAAIKRSNRNITLNSTVGTSYTATPNNPTVIANYYGGASWNGRIGEMLIYSNTALTAAEKQKINSYLAVKWGVTLNQTVPVSYLASDSTVIWDATANSGYTSRITGIGRDDCSGLIQKQSRNQDTTGIAYVAMGLGSVAATNAANTGTFAADKNFVVWADDNTGGSAATTVTGDGTITLNAGCSTFGRLARTFKVQETGSVGPLQVVFNKFTGVSIGASASDFYLAINGTSTFTGVIEKLVPATSFTNGVLVFDNVDFAANSARFFTVIGKKSNGPAGVTAGVKLWLKADAGITLDSNTVTQWDDLSSNGRNMLGTAGTSPTFLAGNRLMNFNPAIRFNGSQELATASNNAVMSGAHNNVHVFAVTAEGVDGGQTSSFISQAPATAGNRFDYVTYWTDGKSYLDMPSSGQYSGTVTGVITGVPDVWQFSNEPGATGATIRKSNRALTPATGAGASYTAVAGNPTLLGSYYGNTSWNGKMGEVLIYSNTALTATEKQKINSYLAIKWGVTLDQTAATNYLASDASVTWNATAAGARNHNIAGIGRDVCSELHQKQSQSVNPGAQVTMGIGSVAATNALNADTLADMNFLTWADDNGALTANPAPVPAATSLLSWLTRTWQTQETGTVGSVELIAPVAVANALNEGGGQLYLIVSDNAAFTANVVEVPMTNNGTAGWSVSYDFNGVQYFTFGKKAVPEICDNSIDDDLDGLVDSYDDACACDMDAFNAQCTSTCNFAFTPEPFAMKNTVTSPQSTISYSTNFIGDIDADGVVEIVNLGTSGAVGYTTTGLQVFNGETGVRERLIATENAAGTDYIMSWNDFMPFAIANVDSTPESEIFTMADNGYLFCYRYDGAFVWRSDLPCGYGFMGTERHGSAMNLADFNSDGVPELYVYDQIFNARTGVKLAEGGGTNGYAYTNPNAGGYGSHPVAADVLPASGGLELVCGRTVYQVTINNAEGTAGNVMTPINAPAVSFGAAAATLKDGFSAVADMDDDGLLDVVVTTSQGPMAYVWNPRTATIMSSVSPPANNAVVGVPFVGRFSSSSCTLGIGFCESLKVLVYDYAPGTLTQKWTLTTSDGSGATGMTLFDFNQDGKDELVYRDESTLRIINAETGATLTSQPCASGTYLEMPTIADVAGDGTSRICINCATAGFLGNLKIFASAGQPWAPARKVWNQQAYHVTNINDDLTVPVREQNVADTLVSPNCAAPCRNTPYNAFLRQATFRTRSGCVQFVASDATVAHPAITYGCPLSEVAYTVTNLADVLSIPAGTPVAFFNGDPMQPGAVLIGMDTLEENLAAGDSIRMEKALIITPAMASFPLYVVVNADTSKPVPLSFPVTNIPECNYTNNITSMTAVLPTAGPDDTVCFNSTAVLAAISTGTDGIWSASSANPGTATISLPESALTDVTTFSVAGDYNFIWNFNGCTDTAEVAVNPVPDAGPDQMVPNFVTGSATMAATGTATWSLGAGSAGTATIALPTSPTTTVSDFSVSGTYQMVYTSSSGCVDTALILASTPLPVDLLHFSAARQGSDALLSWSVASAENTARYVIEHSRDGRNYSAIGSVTASHDLREYRFTHDQPAAGAHYYRLKLVNENGAFGYSEVRVLNFGGGSQTIIAYPNPAKNSITVSGVEAGMELRILAANGSVITRYEAAGNTQVLPTANLAAGVYLIEVTRNGTAVNAIRFTKE